VASENLLIVADSERNADMLYAVRTFVPDPFIWFTRAGKPHVVVNDLELHRIRTEARHCRALPYSRYESRLERENGGGPVRLGDVLVAVLKEQRIKKVTVAESFPFSLARALRARRIKVKLRSGAFFPDRAWKTADEVKKINAALVMAEVGLSEGLHALSRARADRNRRLVLHHSPLTSERLRSIIDSAIVQAGGQPQHTIVACGRQACDPHERGHGPLLANEPILIDLFPRSQRTGYCGDVTRTVVRGRASETVRRMFAAVAEAQSAAMALVRHGVATADVHHASIAVLKRHGFRTGRRNGRLEGCPHGTGHGIGLEVHESPRLTARSREVLRAGHVVTIEPGLYYPGIGGVRLEDVVLVTRGKPRLLTQIEKRLEI